MIAVDANGADQGPAAVAEGARRSGTSTLVFGPEAELGEGIEVVDAPEAIEAGAEPVRAVRERPEASIVQAAKAVADGRADALVSAGSTGPDTRRRHAEHQADQGRPPARSRRARADPGQARCCSSTAGRTSRCGRSTSCSSPTWAPGSWRPCTALESPSVGLLSVGEEQGKGTPDVLEAGRRLEEGDLNFVGNLEGFDLPGAGADVIVSDGFTGNVALKVLEGTSRVVRDAIRERDPLGPGVERSAAC